jgi:CBS domain-containing protein
MIRNLFESNVVMVSPDMPLSEGRRAMNRNEILPNPLLLVISTVRQSSRIEAVPNLGKCRQLLQPRETSARPLQRRRGGYSVLFELGRDPRRLSVFA